MNIDTDTANGDISCCNVSLSMLSKSSILDSIKKEYITNRKALNTNAERNPIEKDMKNAAT